VRQRWNSYVVMPFKLNDRVRRIGKCDVYSIEDIREPDEHVLRLNPGCETMYWIRPGGDDIRVWAKESELEPENTGQAAS
jgi:hypothetical protein